MTQDKNAFDWRKLSPENLKIAQKVIKITLNFLQLHPINRLSLTTKISLQKFENEQVYPDDIIGVLGRIEGIKIKNDELRYKTKEYRRTRIMPPSGITAFGNNDELPNYLPSEEELQNYVFLQISSLDELHRTKGVIDDLLGKLDLKRSNENKDEIQPKQNNQVLITADRKKLCLLEKVKEEWDLAPTSYEKDGIRVVLDVRIPDQRYDRWIRECELGDEQRLIDILSTFKQKGVISLFRKITNLV